MSKKNAKTFKLEEEVEEDPQEYENEEVEYENDEEDDTKIKKKKATIHDHINHYNTLLDLINGEIDRKSRSKENGVRVLQKARKLVESMRKELPHITRSKEARAALSTRKNTSSGFTIKYYVSEELANFLQIDSQVDTVSRVDATRAICVYARLKEDEKREEILKWSYLNPEGSRDLQNPENKRTLIPDKTLAVLFGLPPSKKSYEPMNYTSIQKYIGHHFLEQASSE